jgi:carboxyl-terminal processing protease
MAKGTLYQYTLGYVDANRDKIKQQYPTLEEFDKSFTVTPEMTQSLIDKAEKAGIKFDQEQYDKSAPTLLVIIKALIARDIYKDGAYYVIANRLDPIFNEGLRLINSQKEYSKLLNQ